VAHRTRKQGNVIFNAELSGLINNHISFVQNNSVLCMELPRYQIERNSNHIAY